MACEARITRVLGVRMRRGRLHTASAQSGCTAFSEADFQGKRLCRIRLRIWNCPERPIATQLNLNSMTDVLIRM